MFKNKIAKFIMILKITTKTPFIANERFLVYNIVISANLKEYANSYYLLFSRLYKICILYN